MDSINEHWNEHQQYEREEGAVTADEIRRVAQFVENTALDALADYSETLAREIALPFEQGDLKVFPRPAPQHRAAEQGFVVLREITEQTVVALYALASVLDNLDNASEVPATLLVPVLPYVEAYRNAVKRGSIGSLSIAFPISETELRLVFSQPVDRDSAEQSQSYTTDSGLRILGASVDPKDPKRVTLKTEQMDGAAMKIDVVRCNGVRLASGAPLLGNESPRFIQGIASTPEIQRPIQEVFPFTSHFVGLRASGSCGKDGGVDSNRLVDALGFAFIHREAGGPFNSLKIVTKKHIPGITEAVERLQPGQTVHVLWAGGEIRTVDGETRLVDTGFMEGSIIEPTVLKSPPSYPIKTAEISREAGMTLRAKSLQGVVVHFDNVTIDEVSAPGERGLRSIMFHDESGEQAAGILLDTVTKKIKPGQSFKFLRGLVHQPRAGSYEVIVEMNEHLR